MSKKTNQKLCIDFHNQKLNTVLVSKAYFLMAYSKRLCMLETLHASAKGLVSDVNNFLKNEAEIITDFKSRIVNSIREIDQLHAHVHISYNRIINKMNEAECTAFLSDASLFMEENY